MKTYEQIHFGKVANILMQAAQGVTAITGYDFVVSDMVYSLNNIPRCAEKRPIYIAIREMGTECGDKEYCIERCKTLGYPLVIAKIEQDKICDYNLTLMLTHNWMSGYNNSMKLEFDSL